MTPDMKIKLRTLLIRHESYKLLPYLDTASPPNITIGIGRNLSGRGVLPVEIDMMFDHDVDHFFNFLSEKFDWFNKLNEARQCALVDMCFMGTKSFLEFKEMISCFEKSDFEGAAKEIENSHYETEVHQRAHDLADIIRNGSI
jgi:lysozyme